MEIAQQAQQTSFNDLLSILAVIGAIIVGLYLLTWRWSKLVLKTNTETIKTSVDALNTRINDTNNNLTLLRTELHQRFITGLQFLDCFWVSQRFASRN